MAGLLDALAGSDDPSTADPNTGLVEAQRRQLAFNTLGQTGALLLAAGERQMPAQRAQYLAQLGNVPGNIQTQASAMSQQNVEAQRGQALRTKVEQQRAAQQYVNSPEYLDQLAKLPGYLKAQVIANIKAGDYDAATRTVTNYTTLQLQAQRENTQLEMQRRREDAAMALQHSREDAAQRLQTQREDAASRNAPPTVTTDADGNPWAYDRQTRQWKPVQLGGAAGGDPYSRFGMPPPGPTTGGSSPTGQILPTAPGREDASADPRLPYNEAFGPHAALGYGQHAIQDFLGAGMSPALVQQNAAIAQVEKVRTELKNEARSDSPGSTRLKAAYNDINALLPPAASFFTGPRRAHEQLIATRDSMAKELENTQKLFEGIRGKDRNKQLEYAGDIMSLRKNLANIGIIIDSMAAGRPVTQSGGAQPAQGSAPQQLPPPPGGFDPRYDYRPKPDGSGWQYKAKK
jgi:hypothetical protein